MHNRRWMGLAAIFPLALFLVWDTDGAEPKAKVGPDFKQWDQVVDRAIGYLKTTQAEDGSWSRGKSPGVTGIVLTGLFRTGKVTPSDPVAARALKQIESLINTKAGHIAGP